MPKTTKRWDHRQNIGGVFSDRTNADKAIQAFHDLGVKEQDIEEVVSLNDTARNGKILVTVHKVKDPGPIIDIFDANKAEYNPDGSYNFRDDVAGLTGWCSRRSSVGWSGGRGGRRRSRNYCVRSPGYSCRISRWGGCRRWCRSRRWRDSRTSKIMARLFDEPGLTFHFLDLMQAPLMTGGGQAPRICFLCDLGHKTRL